jgi:hypothetical protein
MRALLGRLARYAKGNPDVAAQVGTGSALAGGFGLLSGSVPAAAAYGATDFLMSYPATLAARKVGEKLIKKPVNILGRQVKPETLRGGLEGTANVVASVASPLAVDATVGRYLFPEPTNQSQQQQIMQEMQQRAAVNQLQGPQAVAPGTQFQMQGLEHTFLRNYVKPQNYVEELMPEYEQYLAQVRNPLGA